MPKKKDSIFEKPGEQDKDDAVEESPEQFRDEEEEHGETPEERGGKMREGSANIDVYSEEGREELVEEDEVASWEEGFVEGEANPEIAHCAQCGKVLGQEESKIIEQESDHMMYVFCSAVCADKGVKHGKKA
jgi:hypothetical protein